MKTSFECANCLVHSFSNIIKLATNDAEVRYKLATDMIKIIAEYFDKTSPANIGTKLNELIMRYNSDPFKKIKEHSKEVALKVFEKLKNMDLTLENALKAALLGNILDFVVKGWDYKKQDIDKLFDMPIKLNHIDYLKREIDKANTLMYLTDNAGEVVLDYFLVKYLKDMGKRVILSPKESPIQNDATISDVEGTPLYDIIDDIVPTAGAVGLNLDKSPDSFKKAFKEADVYIMKGMGYYENAFELELNAFFVLKAKCRPVAASLGVELGDNAVIYRLAM